MPTIDWPEALIPQTAQLTLRKAGAQFASPFNGTLQAVDFVGERWTLSASLAQMSARNPRGVGAWCNRLAGGVERVRVWPFHTGGVPRGSMRGAVTLSAGVARGAVALPVAGAVSAPNLIFNGSFEENPTGLATGWGQKREAQTGTVTPSRVAGNGSTYAQRYDATSLGTASADQLGVIRFNVPAVAGRAYSMAVDTRDSGALVRLVLEWVNPLGVVLAYSTVVFGTSGAWVRRSLTDVAPAGTDYVNLFVWMEARISGPGPAWIEMDNVQFEQAQAPTPYAGGPTLRAGDFLGAGGQLFQVAADTTLSDLGTGSVPIVNRVRSTIAAGSPVTWYRPTCEMVLPAMQAGPVHRPGVIESTALDLVEVW